MVSRATERGGGAGRVAGELVRGVRGIGHDVDHFVRRVEGREDAVGRRVIAGFPGDVLLRNVAGVDSSGARLLRPLARGGYDVVHFHDHVVGWGVEVARMAAARRPVVVTLHDFSGITGGCLNPGDCTRYEGGCGACPQVGRWPLRLPVDMTRRGYRRNARLAATGRVTAVAPSEFLAAAARRGAWGNAPLVVIPNPVDLATFHPGRRQSALERLARGRSVVLMVAADLDHPRKGLQDLLEAWPSILAEHPAELWLVGRCVEMAPAARKLGPSVSLLGSLDTSPEMADRYAAASLTVVPSHEDNAPCTVSESLACGTPVVGYPTGGIPDMIEDGAIGAICAEASASALGVAMRHALGSLVGAEVRERAAEHARDRWSHDRVARAHVDLYRDLVVPTAGRVP